LCDFGRAEHFFEVGIDLVFGGRPEFVECQHDQQRMEHVNIVEKLGLHLLHFSNFPVSFPLRQRIAHQRNRFQQLNLVFIQLQ
jgi:hypothetical protein